MAGRATAKAPATDTLRRERLSACFRAAASARRIPHFASACYDACGDRRVGCTKGTRMQIFRAASLVAAILTAMIGAQAAAQSPEQFYGGKAIDLVIGYPPAGSNDTYARLLGRHLGRHVPGTPTLLPQNMPGAGSFLSMGSVYNGAPKDGSVIGIGAPTAPLDEKLGTQGVRFKTAELNWIGRVDSLINIVFMWKTSPVKTVADAQKIESTLSGTGAGSPQPI